MNNILLVPNFFEKFIHQGKLLKSDNTCIKNNELYNII